MSTLTISEDFYSIQCEGATTGYPAYFIRLKNCNLMCGGKDRKLMHEGLASWWCDSEYVWRKGVDRDTHYLPNRWEEQGIKTDIASGLIHLIWTGGEPTMPKHQKAIVHFLGTLKFRSDIVYNVYNEIETNGTIYIRDELFQKLNQINCSVKLSNSGMKEQLRIKPKALNRIMEHDNYWFKFVVSTEEDILECFRDFIEPFNIPLDRVIIMPGLDKQEDFHERTQFVLEMAKKYKIIGLTRLHISAWNQTVGC
jgi:7-carboxy-7-deazaguanine synthase